MNQKLTLILAFVLLKSLIVYGQSDTVAHNAGQRKWYFYWGYNRAVFSKTNLHFHGPNYDFTLYNLKGKDQPVALGWSYLNPETFTVPQYNVRLGYFIGRNFHISFGMDHMKYVLTQGQQTTISGVISEQASAQYVGYYLNQPLEIQKDIITFEHTNGFNLTSLDLEWLFRFKPRNGHWSLGWNIGLGGIWMVTKTDVRIFGDGLDNDFHVAGFTMAAKTGPRIEWNRRFFLSAEAKGGYTSMPSVLIKNDAPELGDHNLSYFEWYVVAGVSFGRTR